VPINVGGIYRSSPTSVYYCALESLRTPPPTAGVLSGMAGGALAAYGLRRRVPLSLALGAAGVGLLAREVTHMEMKRLLCINAGHHAVEIQRTINIVAPVEEVYRFWLNFEIFPRFMTDVRGACAS
jgi:uncharacterized membrane protein